MQHPTRPIPRPWAACWRATRWSVTAAFVALATGSAGPALAQTLTFQQQLARDIYKELVEINTVTATGDTARAADAMAARLRGAGIDDAKVFKPAPRKGNLVARLRGTGARKPILLMAHLDVVEALASDWSFDPFKGFSVCPHQGSKAPRRGFVDRASLGPVGTAEIGARIAALKPSVRAIIVV